MLSCRRYETRQIQDGRAMGIARIYPSGCPHQPGSQIILTSQYVGEAQGREVPFAVATVVSVRPISVGEMRRDDRLAQMDGFPNGEAWYQHFRNAVYPSGGDIVPLFHLQFRLDDMDRDVMARLGQESPAEQVNVDNVADGDKIQVG